MHERWTHLGFFEFILLRFLHVLTSIITSVGHHALLLRSALLFCLRLVLLLLCSQVQLLFMSIL